MPTGKSGGKAPCIHALARYVDEFTLLFRYTLDVRMNEFHKWSDMLTKSTNPALTEIHLSIQGYSQSM
jgi:hypothetical protein